jgi:ABC-type nitrate/sulfonate/bicarbonate transport system permease component
MSNTFRHDEAFVGVMLLTGFGVGVDLLIQWATRKFLPWYRRDERAN